TKRPSETYERPEHNVLHAKKPPRRATRGFAHPRTPSGWTGRVLILPTGRKGLEFLRDCPSLSGRLRMGWGLVSFQPSPSFSLASGVLLDAIFSPGPAGL